MWVVPVVVALIGGPMMWLLTRFDRRNTEQHGANMKCSKKNIEGKIDKIDDPY
jgi:cytochrome c-type biogenesis protein CcmH/NrfF